MTLGVSERTVRRAIADGRLAARKQGRAFAIRPEALAGFLARRGVGAEPAPESATPPPTLSGLPSGSLWRRPALPRPITRFVGREREVALIVARLHQDDVRLLTLTGPGGVGKTRLALRVAEVMASEFTGAVFVSLETVSRPDLMLPVIAHALGLRAAPDLPLVVSLAAALHDQRMLLVLDNVEHLLGAAVDLADLLANCPGLTVLATSREPLRLSGEHRIATPPLALPEAGQAMSPEHLGAIEAIALFIERARQVRPNFALDAGNAATVHAICRRLDGLPLAIELAAPWLRLLAPGDLLTRLEPRLPLLTDEALDRPARFQTMRHSIAWSYDLLSAEEQRLLRRLAVFSGGFMLAAAEHVGGDDGISVSSSALAGLAGLTDKSLLQVAQGDGREPRYLMLETIREFALEHLMDSGEAAAARSAHADYYLILAEEAARDAGGASDSGWMRRLATERSNVWSALDWLETTRSDAKALQLAGALWHYWYRLGDLAEGRIRLERALAAAPPGVDQRLWARASRGAGVLAWQSAEYDRSRQHLDAALVAYRAIGEQQGIAWVLNSLGCLAATVSVTDEAETHLVAALTLFRELDDAVGVANLTCNLGELAAAKGEHTLAVTRLEDGLAMWRALGDRVGAVRAMVYLGQALLAQGEVRRAEMVLLEALAAIRDLDYRQILPAALRTLADLATRRGDRAAAARWYGAADGFMSALGVQLPATRRDEYEQILATLREWLGEPAFVTAWSEGRSDPAGAIDAALVDWDPARTTGRIDEAQHGEIEPFTRRQCDVLRLMVLGRTDKEIAEALFISRPTASKHVAAILSKCKADSRTAAVVTAIRLGLA